MMDRPVPIKFYLSHMPAGMGGRARVCGNHGALGWWEPQDGVALRLSGPRRWMGYVEVPSDLEYEFKVAGVEISSDGSVSATWEEGPNRAIKVPAKAATVHILCKWGQTQNMEVFVEEPRYEEDIQQMLRAPRPPKGGVLLVGSSIFREWVAAPKDLAPLPVINRAFGGSQTIDQLDRIEQIVLPLEPRMVVYYCGSNDVNGGVPAANIAANIVEFSQRLHRRLPGALLIYVAIYRSPDKADKFDIVNSANDAVAAFCAVNGGHAFVDLNSLLYESDGHTPRYELYRDDMLHFHPHVYQQVFAPALKPRLDALWEGVKDAGSDRAAL